MSYALGQAKQTAQAGEAAGPVNGVLTLRVDVQVTARHIADAYGSDVGYDRRDYERLLLQAKNSPDTLTDQRLAASRVKNFVMGVMADVISGLARAEQLAGLPVRSQAEREQNQATQAQLIGASRIMFDSANTMLSTVVPVREGAAGLGNPWLLAVVIVAIAAVYVVVGVAAVAAIALCYDSKQRLAAARVSADRACTQAGGCSAAEYAAIVRNLQLGPLDTLAEGGAAATEDIGLAIGLTVGAVGLGALVLGGAYFLFGTERGRKTLRGMRGEGKKP
jgi:hypothetical protein